MSIMSTNKTSDMTAGSPVKADHPLYDSHVSAGIYFSSFTT